MAELAVSTVAPIQETWLARFTGGWKLNDLVVEPSRFAVSGHTENGSTTFIDLFAMNDSDTPLHQKESLRNDFPFSPVSRWRYVSFIDGDSSIIFTLCGNVLELYNIKTKKTEHTVNESSLMSAQCLAIREGEIYIGFHMAYIVMVYDTRLTPIRRVNLKQMEDADSDWPADIAVNQHHLFISTERGRALKFDMDGSLKHKYASPQPIGNSLARSVTVNNESCLVFVLWTCYQLVHPVVVAGYSVQKDVKLFNFAVNVQIMYIAKIRTCNSNRLMIATGEGHLSVYNTDARSVKDAPPLKRHGIKNYIGGKMVSLDELPSSSASKFGGTSSGVESDKYLHTAVSREHLQELSVNIPGIWKNLGRYLSLEDADLTSIDINERDEREKCYQMLLKWKQKNASKATYRILGMALQKSDRTDLKEFIDHKAKCQ